jgi:hypothetical protein
MGGMLTNNSLRAILSNMILNFTYSTNDTEREKVVVFGRKILELEF